MQIEPCSKIIKTPTGRVRVMAKVGEIGFLARSGSRWRCYLEDGSPASKTKFVSLDSAIKRLLTKAARS